ncbi:hypothetical protein [Pricia sp.]|uniref:hypothetical protein n=1 Tax=Pricia sp. TaxID=2268138 RepID=UPI003593912A
MKNAIITVLIGLIGLTAHTQKIIEKTIDYKKRTILLDVKFASEIVVKTWDSPTVYFKADITTKDEKYLDLYQLDIDESDSNIKITSDAEPMFRSIWKDKNQNGSGGERHNFSSDDDYTFNYTLYVPKNASFKISSINGNLKSEIIEGDFTADLINGDIDIEKYSGDLGLSTINGEIDLKIHNATLIAETIHGSIYADKGLSFKSEKRHVGQKIEGSFEDASSQLRLNTINGNLYLRL